jgi:hypothetical protein
MPNSVLQRVAVGIALLASGAMCLYCVWALDRGFEGTDESYYLLLAIHPEAVRFYVSAQQWLSGWLWSATRSLPAFRGAGLLCLVGSAILLGLGASRASARLGLTNNDNLARSLIATGSIVGSLLYASTINLSPSYNLLASAGTYASAGLVLLACFEEAIRLRRALLLLAGGCLAIVAICKLSSGLATLGILFAWAFSLERGIGGRILDGLSIILGLLAAVAIALFLNTTLSEAVQGWVGGLQLFRMVQTEAIEARLVRYLVQYIAYLVPALWAFTLPLTAVVLYTITSRSLFAWVSLVSLIATLIFGGIKFGAPTLSVRNATFDGFLFGGWGMHGSQIAAALAILLIMLFGSISGWLRTWDRFIFIVGLLVLPYAVAIGTGNALFTQVIDSLAPWGALIAVMMVNVQSTSSAKSAFALIGATFMITMTFQLFTSSARPYHVSSPLTQQNMVFHDELLGSIRVDDEGYRFLSGSKAALSRCRIPPGSSLFGLYNIPGLALALGAVAPASPWLNHKEQAEFVMARMRQEETRSVLVAVQVESDGSLPPLPRQLSGFPTGFRHCGDVVFPYTGRTIAIWHNEVQ